jgi:hypothetical protein
MFQFVDAAWNSSFIVAFVGYHGDAINKPLLSNSLKWEAPTLGTTVCRCFLRGTDSACICQCDDVPLLRVSFEMTNWTESCNMAEESDHRDQRHDECAVIPPVTYAIIGFCKTTPSYSSPGSGGSALNSLPGRLLVDTSN